MTNAQPGMILDRILAETRRRLAEVKAQRPWAEIEAALPAASPARGFAAALRRRPIACIAEFKRRSPSAGWIRQDADPVEVAGAYERAGAAALSVLTDEPFFGGTLDDLRRARAATGLPVLRKDFVVDAYQIAEARAAGADAVLLIVAALSQPELVALLADARRFGLDALVEAHDEEEVERALAAGAAIIGINHRDLRTFEMDMDLAVRMRPRIPADRVVVAESGLRSRADVVRMQKAHIDAILVGENLMRAPDPGEGLVGLLSD